MLLPLTRWLFEYSQDNFRRQHHLNRILFACIEELAHRERPPSPRDDERAHAKS